MLAACKLYCRALEKKSPPCSNLIVRYDANHFRLGWRHLKRGVGGGGDGGVMEGKESKSESSKMAKGDAIGQSGPFVCLCVCLRGYGK